MAPPFTGATTGRGNMAVNIRKSKKRKCESCESNGGVFYDIGIGPQKGTKQIITLCDACMHSLLQKLLIVGSEHNEVH